MQQSYQITFNVAWQRENSEDFVFIKDYIKNEFVVLEDVSKDIWMGVIRGLTRDEIQKDLLDFYDGVDADTIGNDIDDFISQCVRNGWIEVCNEKLN